MEEQLLEYRRRQKEKFEKLKFGHCDDVSFTTGLSGQKRSDNDTSVLLGEGDENESDNMRPSSSSSLGSGATTTTRPHRKRQAFETETSMDVDSGSIDDESEGFMSVDATTLKAITSRRIAKRPRVAMTKQDESARVAVTGTRPLVGAGTDPLVVDDNTKLKLISWNIDGLNEKYLQLRTLSVIDTVRNEQPAAVLLQEIVPVTHAMISRSLKDSYLVVDPSSCRVSQLSRIAVGVGTTPPIPAYYCILLLHKAQLIPRGDPEIVWHHSSQMGRHLIVQRVSPAAYPQDEMVLMTSHLESCKEHAEERSRQLSSVLTLMELLQVGASLDEDSSVPCASSSVGSIYFGGDMNVRDAEVKTTGIPACVNDTWNLLESPADCRYTWDTLVNHNCELSGSFKPRMRFDRIYCAIAQQSESDATSDTTNGDTRGATRGVWEPKRMNLVGVDTIQSIGMHASDHFGISLHIARRVGGTLDALTGIQEDVVMAGGINTAGKHSTQPKLGSQPETTRRGKSNNRSRR